MTTEYFEGFALTSTSKEEWNHPKKIKFTPKQFKEHDIDVKITCCGVCGSDVHAAHGSWGEMTGTIVGHEIVGTVTKVGSKVESLKVGQRVGVGALALSCLEGVYDDDVAALDAIKDKDAKKCTRCKRGLEQYCVHRVGTFGYVYADGTPSNGGYSSHIRVHEYFAFAIPENLKSENVAPMMCGGITVFSPLVKNNTGPGKKVGIAGIGGIGHMGILFAKALGAEVFAISRSHSKEADALKLGADHYIATDDEGWNKEFEGELDLIVNCASSLTQIDVHKYLSLLDVYGKFENISAPPATEKLELYPQALGDNSAYITSSAVGSRAEIVQMLELSSKHNIVPWIETIPVGEKGIAEALQRGNDGDVRYRFTLVDYDSEFGS